MTRFALPKPLEELSETEWDGMLFRSSDSLAKMTGWLTYHTLRSKGSKAGYPDRTLVKDRIVFAELKRHKAKPTDLQVEWLDRLARAGGEVYLWRPTDLDEVTRIMGRRWRFVPFRPAEASDFGSSVPYLVATGEADFVPASLWIPGLGRADEAGLQSAA